MRLALKTKATQRQQIVKTKTYPAPIGGWNARDALAEMPPTDAVILDNFFPKASYCELRGGYLSHTSTGSIDLITEDGFIIQLENDNELATEDTFSLISGTIKTLAVYNGLSGSNKLFAITEHFVYDVTNPGPPSAGLIARTNAKHQWWMFGDGTSNWLIACNGVDKPLYYDGTTFTAVDNATSPALTGLDTTKIIGGTAYKGRLFFIERASLNFWYLAAAVAGGALTKFDLSSQCKRGGYLMAIGSWTRDAGDGQDDVFVAITSEGECVIYQGDNPSQANSWSKVGSFFVGRPLGRRCLLQYGGDLIILTENGAFPLSAALQSASIDFKFAISSKIEKAFTEAGRTYGATFGWEAIVYPGQQALIVNVPVAEDGTHYQYVMNTMTQAWCRFLDWDAETFTMFNRELYFARGSNVYRAWTGSIDGTDNIEGYGKQAFSYFGNTTALKKFKLYRPMLTSNGTLSYFSSIDVDFEETLTSSQTVGIGGSQATWNVSQWNNARWGGSAQSVKRWTSIAQWPGFCGAGKLRVATNSLTCQWMAGDYVWEEGGIL